MTDPPHGDTTEPELPLLGGDVTEGVVRVGETVRRPSGPHTQLVDAVLAHLEQVGFGGAPRALGRDARGRQVVSYVAGEVAGRPWPSWVADDERAVSVARLVRSFDDAMQSFGIPALARGVVPPDPPGTPASTAGRDTFVGHLDITPENVVFRDGRAYALIDFDLCRPTDRVREVANLVLWWAPLIAPADRERAVRDVDAISRAALLVDAYGLGDDDRACLVESARNGADRAWHTMRARAVELGGGWQRMWDDGIGDVILRRQQWLADNAGRLQAAVT